MAKESEFPSWDPSVIVIVIVEIVIITVILIRTNHDQQPRDHLRGNACKG